MTALLVKICGLTRHEDAAAALAAGADLLGFVFVPGTPRALAPERCSWVRELAGRGTVGVFRDASLEEVRHVRETLGLDRIQLHGAEPDGWLDVLGPQTLRRLPLDEGVDWRRVRALDGRCLPLFDPGAGDGRPGDWSRLQAAPPGLRFGIAGGLGPATVASVVRAVRPALVDVSSGVERAPGIKDPDALRRFVGAARGAWGEAEDG